ncbi:hypothetical protein EI77_02799 [Prosthecobacter fusiformis]|uniref:YXWGXW repeat-containing protein n=1 Tax=Prosthecobacter fusiformis TaxID=48464 RepID=A0A4R7RY36_9BACT|nr:hypothetical protein [Prosthecobacter fusiformis]TDU70751.1 hypothetical protein EI77_02799 [Prosthecobacter fusiformis]
MNAKFLLRASLTTLCLAMAIGLTSCTSALERRIARNPDLYNKLPTSDRMLVEQGRIREGFTKESVFLSWGRPDQVSEGSQKGTKIEKWTYVGTQPVYTDSFGWGGMGWGRGYGRGYGYYGAWDPFWGGYGPTVTYVPYKAASVTFRGNRVTEYLRGPQ